MAVKALSARSAGGGRELLWAGIRLSIGAFTEVY
ncbi:hypothetical protein GKJPGBOP_02983 [Streptomyces paromomycinus]|uniref:Uncharacterized protein n=1 Tax=Streptomyces paromomycinus TaxID=92743 RepID=A0A401W1Y5_STREY|nr:hypothetical protein GKJPGBOP_02983 [Streptomyces paromomycinus]